MDALGDVEGVGLGGDVLDEAVQGERRILDLQLVVRRELRAEGGGRDEQKPSSESTRGEGGGSGPEESVGGKWTNEDGKSRRFGRFQDIGWGREDKMRDFK